jgi:hypothetical protein
MQTLGNHGKLGSKEAFMTTIIDRLESFECRRRVDSFLSTILHINVDSEVEEDAPVLEFCDALSDECLTTIRNFFCRRAGSPKTKDLDLLTASFILTLLFRHSCAILRRLQQESISSASSLSEVVSKDLNFVATIACLHSSSYQLSPQAKQGPNWIYITIRYHTPPPLQ